VQQWPTPPSILTGVIQEFSDSCVAAIYCINFKCYSNGVSVYSPIFNVKNKIEKSVFCNNVNDSLNLTFLVSYMPCAAMAHSPKRDGWDVESGVELVKGIQWCRFESESLFSHSGDLI
jgi:hypothetical protein